MLHILSHITTLLHFLTHVTTMLHILAHITTMIHILEHKTSMLQILAYVKTMLHILSHITTLLHFLTLVTTIVFYGLLWFWIVLYALLWLCLTYKAMQDKGFLTCFCHCLKLLMSPLYSLNLESLLYPQGKWWYFDFYVHYETIRYHQHLQSLICYMQYAAIVECDYLKVYLYFGIE